MDSRKVGSQNKPVGSNERKTLKIKIGKVQASNINLNNYKPVKPSVN